MSFRILALICWLKPSSFRKNSKIKYFTCPFCDSEANIQVKDIVVEKKADGKIKLTGSGKPLLKNKQVQKLYLGG